MNLVDGANKDDTIALDWYQNNKRNINSLKSGGNDISVEESKDEVIAVKRQTSI